LSEKPWLVELARTAQHDLRRLDPPVRTRVETALIALARDPHEAGQLRKLTGAPEWRLRVGDWRVILQLDPANRLIQVIRILPRGRAYDR
jgi:mRNA interferase RelE/StbE